MKECLNLIPKPKEILSLNLTLYFLKVFHKMLKTILNNYQNDNINYIQNHIAFIKLYVFLSIIDLKNKIINIII